MGVLLTCVGKRYDIVASFVEAQAKTGFNGTVVAADGNELAPAQYAADVRTLVPSIDDKAYLLTLLEICREHEVNAVVALTDLDIELLARSEDKFAALGATAFVPDLEVASSTFDKYEAHKIFIKLDLPSPPTYIPDDLPVDVDFPVMIKPRRGSGARSIYKAHDREQMEFFIDYVDEPVMVQRFMGGDEISVDILCDRKGRCVNAIPRTMLESRGGESIKGATIADDEMIELGRRVGESLPCRGPATVQCFRDPDYGLGITDVNCRFGGAFPAPMYAGGDYPELILRMAHGEDVSPRVGEFEAGRWFSRYFWHLEMEEKDGVLQPTASDFVRGGPPKPH